MPAIEPMSEEEFNSLVKAELQHHMFPGDTGKPTRFTADEAGEMIEAHREFLHELFLERDRYINQDAWISASANNVWIIDYC